MGEKDRTHLEIHVGVGRHEHTLVLHAPLKLDDDLLSRQRGQEWLWINNLERRHCLFLRLEICGKPAPLDLAPQQIVESRLPKDRWDGLDYRGELMHAHRTPSSSFRLVS